MRPLPLLLACAALFAAVAVSLCLGRFPLAAGELARFFVYKLGGGGVFDADRLRLLENLIFEIRLPRVVAAGLIGAALASSGAAYQTAFANPLVSPGLLGVLAGASFGAAVGMVFFHAWAAVQVATLLGGFAAVAVAVGLAHVYRVNTTVMLVLGGIISGALFTSLLSIVKYVADPYNQLPAIVYWLLGNLALADRGVVLKAAVPVGAGIAGLMVLARHLNVLSMGDEEARSLGVHAGRVRMAVIVCATLVSSITVVLAGTISWVGLIVPHFTRTLTGPDNQTLIPAAALLGAAYLIVVDDVARLAFAFEIPIGILTALFGIPCFALVLRNARKGWT